MEDKYLAHDEWDKEKDHLYDLLTAIHDRIDDIHSELNRDITLITLFTGIIAVVIPVVMFYLQNTPH